jgi:diguanylate cyclase (GGDEF)-like protein
MHMSEQQRQLGIAELTARLNKLGLNLVEQSRPWPNRRATYLGIGKADQVANVVLSDEFICDLPATLEYQAAIDSYATAVAGRIRCGPPNLFYCLSNAPISLKIKWPVQSAVLESRPVSWLLTDVINEANGKLAMCSVRVNTHFAYSGRTSLDDVRIATNKIRYAIDDGTISFYDFESHPDLYQEAKEDPRKPRTAKTQPEIEQFIADKTLTLGFQVPDVPREVWVADPWDAEYLGISKKVLAQSAYVLKARGLINLDMTLNFAKPSDKLLTAEWSESSEQAAAKAKIFTLASLLKKEALVADLKKLLKQRSETALLVIDLDKFKEVNDTKGHSEGDVCLERVVHAIGGALGHKGNLYRWGGDEFVITLPDFSKDEAIATAERIWRAIGEAKAGGDDIPVTASIGVCGSEQLTDPRAETLLDAADKAMYSSKREGKNRVTIWSPAQNEIEQKVEPEPTS